MKRRGFTLIELLIVISVIGILSTIAVITYSTVQRNSRDSVRDTQASILDNAFEQYYQKNGEYPPARNIINSYSDNTAQAVAATLGIDPAGLDLPGCPTGVNPFVSSATNATPCQIAYEPSSVLNNTTCHNATNGGCDSFVLTYSKEAGAVVVINSKRTDRPEGTIADAPVGMTLTMSANSDSTIVTAQSSTADCGVGSVAKYSFRYRPNAGTWGSWTVFQTSPSYTYTGLTVGSTYGFQVEGRCDVGLVLGNVSSPSTEVVYTVPVPAPTPPAVTRGTETATTVAFSWPSQLYATSYDYQYRINGGSWSSAQSTTGTSATITSSNTAKVEVQVRAINPVGTSAWSSIASGYLLPAAPTASVGTVTSTTIAYSWTTITNASRYEFQYRTNGGGWSGTNNNGTTTTWTAGPTTQGSKIEIQVHAVNPDGNAGAWSTVVGATMSVSSTPAWNAMGQTDNFPNWTHWVYNTGGAALCPAGTSIYSQFQDGVYGSFWNGYTAWGSNGGSSQTLTYGSTISSYSTTLQYNINGKCVNTASGAQSATVNTGVYTTTHAAPNVVLSGPVECAGWYGGSTTKTTIQLRLKLQEVSYNLDADQSNVNWTLYRIRVAGNYQSWDQTKTWPWSVSINGSGWSGSSNSVAFKNNTAIGVTETIASSSLTVQHDGNGNATIGYSGSDGPGSTVFVSASCSGSYGLSDLR
jgi:prepilin-type N-terminal cleavage/methylation domain-containing protein